MVTHINLRCVCARFSMSVMRQIIGRGRATKRAVSNDYGFQYASCDEGLRIPKSLEGALIGSAVGDARVESRAAIPVGYKKIRPERAPRPEEVERTTSDQKDQRTPRRMRQRERSWSIWKRSLLSGIRDRTIQVVNGQAVVGHTRVTDCGDGAERDVATRSPTRRRSGSRS